MRFSVDRTWRRPAAGDVVIAGSPTRAFKLTPAGRRIVEELEHGHDVTESASELVNRLVDAGAIHPLSDPSMPKVDARSITAVIPVHTDHRSPIPKLDSLVAALDGLAAVVIVDDASAEPLPTPISGATPVSVIRRTSNGGPAAARNTGLSQVTTPNVVFIDADVECRTEDIVCLASWLSVSDAALIAPRVLTEDDGTLIGAYEAVRSPLDMGERPARVRAGTRVGYVPAAVLLCETAAVRSIGGFDESMRTGEDVDLVWRLDAAGFRCRYEPSVEVRHQPRAELNQLLAQRRGYGRSTTALRQRHGDVVAPARGSWTSVGSWVTFALGFPVVALLAAASSGALLARKLRFTPNHVVESTRLAALTHLQVGRNLAAATTRVWWPIAFVAALFSRRLRLALSAAILVPALGEWWEKRPRLDPIRFVVLRVLDDAAYGVGVWQSVVDERDPAPLLPSIHGPTSQNG